MDFQILLKATHLTLTIAGPDLLNLLHFHAGLSYTHRMIKVVKWDASVLSASSPHPNLFASRLRNPVEEGAAFEDFKVLEKRACDFTEQRCFTELTPQLPDSQAARTRAHP